MLLLLCDNELHAAVKREVSQPSTEGSKSAPTPPLAGAESQTPSGRVARHRSQERFTHAWRQGPASGAATSTRRTASARQSESQPRSPTGVLAEASLRDLRILRRMLGRVLSQVRVGLLVEPTGDRCGQVFAITTPCCPSSKYLDSATQGARSQESGLAWARSDSRHCQVLRLVKTSFSHSFGSLPRFPTGLWWARTYIVSTYTHICSSLSLSLSLSLAMYIYIYICIYTYVSYQTYTSMYIYIYTHISSFIHLFMFLCKYVCVQVLWWARTCERETGAPNARPTIRLSALSKQRKYNKTSCVVCFFASLPSLSEDPAAVEVGPALVARLVVPDAPVL